MSQPVIDRAAPPSSARTTALAVVVRDRAGGVGRLLRALAAAGEALTSFVAQPLLDASGSGVGTGLTLVTLGGRWDDDAATRLIARLRRVEAVVSARRLDEGPCLELELALVKLKAGVRHRTEILQIARHCEATVAEYGTETVVLRLVERPDVVDQVVRLLAPLGVVEVARSGGIAMAQGLKPTTWPIAQIAPPVAAAAAASMHAHG